MNKSVDAAVAIMPTTKKIAAKIFLRFEILVISWRIFAFFGCR